MHSPVYECNTLDRVSDIVEMECSQHDTVGYNIPICNEVQCQEMRRGMHVPEVAGRAQGWGLTRGWVRVLGWAWEREC